MGLFSSSLWPKSARLKDEQPIASWTDVDFRRLLTQAENKWDRRCHRAQRANGIRPTLSRLLFVGMKQRSGGKTVKYPTRERWKKLNHPKFCCKRSRQQVVAERQRVASGGQQTQRYCRGARSFSRHVHLFSFAELSHWNTDQQERQACHCRNVERREGGGEAGEFAGLS